MYYVDKITYGMHAETGHVVLLFTQDLMKAHDVTLRQKAKQEKREYSGHYRANPELTLGAAFGLGGKEWLNGSEMGETELKCQAPHGC